MKADLQAIQILFFRFVDPEDGEFRTYNKFGVDLVEVTGDCCFEIGANDDYVTVDPKNPRVVFDTIFYIHEIYVDNNC